ncbi:phage tail tape measure protein [Marinilactibacillus sp. 15R]|uniref:phage tail tape measure protein n=1 Tax=Marinilactibacillus sp. 15R TaxID=1911586 RepID=UPI00090B6D47|nr:phage tail tape measure protein [Marinilactibacillus sp. 15R]API89438.1 phage tail tape measure protein [Marinilactibacillus sp. 15R]
MVQNGKPLGQMVITLGLDTTAFSSTLTGATRATKTATREMAAGFKIVESGGNKLDALSFKNQALTKVVTAQKNELGYLKKAYDNTLDAQGNATSKTAKAAQKYNDAQAKLAGYEAQLGTTVGKLAEMEVKTTGATGAISNASEKLVTAGDKMQSMGKGLTKGVTIPVAGVAAAVTTAAVTWESSFAGVLKTNDEVVDSTGKVVYSYKDLEEGLRNLAKELPSSHGEIAAVAEAAGQLGIQSENVVAFTKTMIDLGESTNLSAETAATQLARFANITKMSQSEFDNAGSSIVALGNNFATTEAEISEMALRLAGAGSQIGLSQADILGLSAALSSVGIEAEMGGSAISKVMVNMAVATETGLEAVRDLEEATGLTRRELELMASNDSMAFTDVAESLNMTKSELNDIIGAGKDLEGFSAIAGMTGDQFVKAFQDDAVGALGAFIEGLGTAEDKGTTAIELLDEMGISEVRLRDSLLRAGNASELFAESVDLSSEAFEENTALTEEAGKRYETTESKLKMLKNEAVDAAIDLGGPFVDALRDGLEASKPLVEMLGDLAEAFSEADPDKQRFIIGLLGTAAAAGPLLSITGKLSSSVGGVGKSFVDLSASMAKKKALEEVKDLFTSGNITAGDYMKTLSSGAGTVTTFGTAAGTAAGPTGLGAMAATLGPLGPAILGIVGVGGALAIGYGAWKLWGEEAYNSAERTRRWGSDVSETADEALNDMDVATSEIGSKYNAMKLGVETDSDDMMASFEKLGTVVEEELNGRIEKFGEVLEKYSDVLSESTKEMLTEEQQGLQDSLENVNSYVERASEIREKEKNSAVDMSAETAKILADLSNEIAKEYVGTLANSEAEQKKILEALTGNIDSASKEQATVWAQNLAEQRQQMVLHTGEMKEKAEEYIEAMELDPDSELAESIREDFAAINEETTNALDAQLALIAEKYPEIAEEISFGNGQLANEMNATGSQMAEANQDIIDNGKRMSNALRESALEAGESVSWMANEGNRGADVWNDLVFEAKQGDFETDLPKLVNEAAEDTATWNNLRFQLKDANISSNAKQIIGEAAIQNGWWDGMSWEEKQIVINDEFSETIIRSLDNSGEWNNLELEEKTALMYSNTPEKMTETLAYLGLWDEYDTEIKQVDADNYGFMVSIMESEEKMSMWQNLNPEVKEILANNYDLMTKLFESDEAYNRFKELPDENKLILGENADLMAAILESEEYYNRWMGLPENDKKFLGDNTDLLSTVLNSETEYMRWLNLPTKEKDILGNNIDLISKILKSEEEYNAWKNLPEFEKKLKVNNYSAVIPTQKAQSLLKDYKAFNPGSKNLPISTNADSTKNALDRARDAWSRISSGTKTFTTRYETVGSAPTGIGAYATRAMGTNFHPGGAMLVNDQKGSKFRELIQRPDGTSYIPEGRNVFLPNEPIGTKVYRASLTEKLFPGIPQYANGVGIPADSTVIQNINRVREATNQNQFINLSNDFSGLENLLRQMLNVVSRQQPQININIPEGNDFDVRQISRDLAFLTQTQERGG